MSRQPFIGEIQLYPYPNNIPQGWAKCDGTLLPIATNQALFSILGTTYGGDGQTTFGLPDLRGRVAIHPSQAIALGNSGGEENHTLNLNEMAAHTHQVMAGAQAPTQGSPAGNAWATQASNAYGTAPDGHMDPSAISPAGGGASHPNMQPYLVLNYYIATIGYYPQRS